MENNRNHTLLIGMDIAQNGADCSAVSAVCSSCRTVIQMRVFPPYAELYTPCLARCPVCGVRFTTRKIKPQ